MTVSLASLRSEQVIAGLEAAPVEDVAEVIGETPFALEVGKVARPTVIREADRPWSVFEAIPAAERDAIRARASTYDCTADINSLLVDKDDVFVPTGTYIVNGILIPTATRFRGQGVGRTVFKQKAAGTGGVNAATVGNLAGTEALMDVGDFRIDGNKANVAAAVHGFKVATPSSLSPTNPITSRNDPAHVISNVHVHDCKGHGFYLSGRGDTLYMGLDAYRPNGHGYYIDCYDSHFVMCHSGGAGLHGMYFTGNGANNRIIGSKHFYTGLVDLSTSGDGIYCSGNRNQFAGLEIQNPGRHGINLFQSVGNVFSAAVLEFPYGPGTGHITRPGGESVDGIFIEDSRYNSFQGHIINRGASSDANLRYFVYLKEGGSGPTNNYGNITGTGYNNVNIVGRGTGVTFGAQYWLVNGQTLFATNVYFGWIPVAADNAAAIAAGIGSGYLYRTTTGEVRMRV